MNVLLLSVAAPNTRQLSAARELQWFETSPPPPFRPSARRASVGLMDAGRALSGKLERSASSGARRMSTSASAALQRRASLGKLGSGKLSSRKDSEEDLA